MPNATIQTKRPLDYWARLGDRALESIGLYDVARRYSPAFIRELARGQRDYPRALAEAVRKLYARDEARRAKTQSRGGCAPLQPRRLAGKRPAGSTIAQSQEVFHA